MARKSIKCFIAMAFGRKDCDVLYDKQILPTLKSLDISTIRVDRREHKDDLNNYIIRMLKESNIVIADLTYARPSVYYEAGYAERKIPVVYTARKDHLSRAQKDERLRVHFDLEMKKIITWQNPNDPTFANRLKRRINYFIKPMKLQKKTSEIIEKDRQAFMSLSISAQQKQINEEFQKKLKAKKFWIGSLWDFDKNEAANIKPLDILIGAKMVDKTPYICFIIVADSLTKKQFELVINRVCGYLLISFDPEEIDEYQENYYFCSLKNVPESRMKSALPIISPSEYPGTYILNRHIYVPRETICKTYLKLISPIKSFMQLKEVTKECISILPDKKTNRYTYLTKDKYPWYGNSLIKFSNRPLPKKSEKIE
jgi:nucleoside 2-deoxyribosyltransferase